MKLLFFLDRFPGYGGIETVTTVLSNLFVNNGNSVVIVSFQQQNLELLEQLDNKVKLIPLPNQDLLSTDNQSFLIKEIEERKIDFIIHQHSYAPVFELIVAIKEQIKCRIFTVEHNTPDAQIKMYSNHLKENNYNSDWKFNLQKLLYPLSIAKCKYKERIRHRYLYKYSDQYILLSERFVNVFQQVARLNNCDKLAWIPNPLPLKEKNVDVNREKIILYVGRIDKTHKRVDRLIKIYEKLTMDYPEWRLVIVGDGPYRKELESYIELKEIQNITFEGFQSNVADYYIKASIICLTSNTEGWPMILGEAMQYGVVPVSFDSYASVYDIIDSGESGFIIPAFSEEEYVLKIKILMDDSKLRKRFSENAVKSSLRYSQGNIQEKWERLFDINM